MQVVQATFHTVASTSQNPAMAPWIAGRDYQRTGYREGWEPICAWCVA